MNQITINEKSLNLLLNKIYAMGITIFLLYIIFFPLDFSLQANSTPLIGEASKNNVSVGSRVSSFYKIIFSGVGLWIVFSWILEKIQFRNPISNKKYSTGLYFIIPLITIIYLNILGANATGIMTLLFGIFILDLIQKIDFKKRVSTNNPNDFRLSFPQILGFVFLIYLGFSLIFGNTKSAKECGVLIFLLATSLVQIIEYLFKSKISETSVTSMFLAAVGIPFFLFFAVEFQIFSLERKFWIADYRIVFISSLVLWGSFCLILNGKWPLKAAKFLQLSFPWALLFGYCLLVYYRPIINPSEEMFELANPANSLLRIFKFGEIPVLDYMSSHMINEQWYGALYQLIFGFKESIDFTIYAFLNQFIFLLFVFYILKKMGFNTHSATLFVILFPILNEVFFVHVIYSFLALFTLQILIQQVNSVNFFKLFFLLFLLLIWRIDTGVAAIFATAACLPIFWWLYKPKFTLLVISKGIGIFGGLILIVLALSLIIRPWEHTWTNFLTALHYIKGSQAHGYTQIFNQGYHQFYNYHVLFVLVAVVLTISAVFKIKSRLALPEKQINNHYLLFAIFSLIVFIANAQRGLVRHGFAEGNESFFISTFYLGTALFIMDYFKEKLQAVQFSVFYSALFLLFIGTKYFPYFPTNLKNNQIVSSDLFKNLKTEISKENFKGRVREQPEFAKRTYGALKTYLDNQLLPNQSFIDFSNTPMLYYYTERSVPGYFNQNLQNTIDEFLQLQLINDFKSSDLPLAIYSSYPPTWFDATDGIQNTERYYLLAEYIFEHYKPIGVLNNKSIFGKKSLEFDEISLKDTMLYQPIYSDLGYLAAWRGNAFYQKQQQNINPTTLFSEKLESNKSKPNSIFLTKEIVSHNHVELILKVKSDNKIPLNNTNYGFSIQDTLGNLKHEIVFKRNDAQFNYYAFRLSNHYYWHQEMPLIITLNNLEQIEGVSIVKY